MTYEKETHYKIFISVKHLLYPDKTDISARHNRELKFPKLKVNIVIQKYMKVQM
ncbi:MAG: hypothetical protein MR384_12885 [Lachnospiraceae bacterium]|nr:hypothetical protein [Lachnospiraceae bacterium]